MQSYTYNDMPRLPQYEARGKPSFSWRLEYKHSPRRPPTHKNAEQPVVRARHGMATAARASRRLAPAGDAHSHAPHPHATPAVGGPVSSGSGSGGGGGRAQFNLSSSAATVVVFVSILLCFILLCTYCRCARQRAVAGARRRVMRDLVPGGVALFLRPTAAALPPVLQYAAAASSAKKGLLPEDCPICLEPFGDDDGVRVVPACGHLYHAPCIDRWLDVRNSCPVCRCAVASLYAAADRDRDAAAVADGAHDDDDDDDDDQEAVLQRVVAMIEAIRDEQREDAAARRAPAGGGGGS